MHQPKACSVIKNEDSRMIMHPCGVPHQQQWFEGVGLVRKVDVGEKAPCCDCRQVVGPEVQGTCGVSIHHMRKGFENIQQAA